MHLAQAGDKHPGAKPLKGFGGAGIVEVVDDYDGDTYRVVYTIRFEGVVYALHAFQKKATQGIQTSQRDIELVRARLKRAQAHDEETGGTGIVSTVEDTSIITIGSGNVFMDLGVTDPADALTKAELVHKISSILKHRHLTHTMAADLLGIDQPTVSALLYGRLVGFTIEHLLLFLITLDRAIDIVVKPKPASRARATVRVVSG